MSSWPIPPGTPEAAVEKIGVASTHLDCRRCGHRKHRDEFWRGYRVCKSCCIAEHVEARRTRRRLRPEVRARERAQDRERRRRERAERQGEIRWRKEWARRTITALRAAGWSYPAIAAAAGICPETARRWARGIGAHIKHGPFQRLWDLATTLRWQEEG